MKKESKPPKTNISVTKRVFSVIVAIIVLAINVSVFAVNDSNYVYQPIPVIPSASVSDILTYGYKLDNEPGSNHTVGALSSDVYVAYYYSGSRYYATAMSRSSGQVAYTWNGSNVIQYELTSYSSTYNLYYRGLDNISSGNYVYINTPYYQNQNAMLSGLNDYLIANPPVPPENGNRLEISLPAGNIIIADISNTGSNPYYLETTSGTTGAVVKPGMNNIQIGYSDTVPSTFTVPNSLWDYPSWSGTGSSSVLGTYNRQSTQGDFALSNTNAQKYVIITNPMYPNDNNASANRLNSDLNITIEKVNSYVIYSLQTGYVSGNLIGTNDGSQYIDYQYDGDTGEWVGTNQDGDPASPVWGGQNDFENTPTTINDWLENIAHQISSFFSGAIGAITTLSVAVKNFASTLMSLYVWLPSPVLSILSSAVMLAIVIGVIKVFI